MSVDRMQKKLKSRNVHLFIHIFHALIQDLQRWGSSKMAVAWRNELLASNAVRRFEFRVDSCVPVYGRMFQVIRDPGFGVMIWYQTRHIGIQSLPMVLPTRTLNSSSRYHFYQV